MREVEVGGAPMDAGPTVFTLPHIFEEIFAEAGTTLSDHVTLRRADVLARHAWTDGSRLDLFADIDRSADAIGTMAGAAEAKGYRSFCAEARRTWNTLEGSFVRSPQPSIQGLVEGAGLRGLGNLWRIRPFETLWGALGDYFHDPRLRQLFGRYATYCGSSPFQAPATLMLVAHVEQEGVWLVEGGMARLAEALAGLASGAGVGFRYGVAVRAITTRRRQGRWRRACRAASASRRMPSWSMPIRRRWRRACSGARWLAPCRLPRRPSGRCRR